MSKFFNQSVDIEIKPQNFDFSRNIPDIKKTKAEPVIKEKLMIQTASCFSNVTQESKILQEMEEEAEKK